MTASRLTPQMLLVAARRVLLDALDALVPHHRALVLVGAQAVYLRTENAGEDLVVAAYTSDGDLAVRLHGLVDEPHLEQALRSANFELRHTEGRVEPGVWMRTTQVDGFTFDVPVDLLVPSSQLTGSRRSAAPAPHERTAARRIDGLDAALIDHFPMDLTALEPQDPRKHRIEVAGTSALLVSKLFKINDRLRDAEAGKAHRLKGGKDAADVFRLMRECEPEAIAARLRELVTHDQVGASVAAAVALLDPLFGGFRTPATSLAVQALRAAVPEDDVRALCESWTTAVLRSYRNLG